MRFEGEALRKILRHQNQLVQLCDAAGVPFRTASAAEACEASLAGEQRLDAVDSRVRTGGFFGVGNKKRIRYLQAINPSVWGAGWRGGSHTTRPARADQTCRNYKPGQVMGFLREHK